jgi:Fe-S-cluster-containing dehydrogenase component
VKEVMLISIRLLIDGQKCTDCKTCELICSFKKASVFNPKVSRIHIATSYPPTLVYPVACIQCEEATCIQVCPVKALQKDEKTGAVILDEEKCTGCKLCVEECPYSAIRMNEPRRKPLICDLCQGSPACVEWCPTGALTVKKLGA